jgi:hypothetical protein
MSVSEFVDDLKKMNMSDQFFEKYRCLVQFPGLTIAQVIDESRKSEGGLRSLLKHWSWEPCDFGVIYMIENEGKYEVFRKSDRGGGKEQAKVFLTLEEAAFDYIDFMMCTLMYAAPDSKISPGGKDTPFLKQLRAERRKKLGLE